MLHLAKRADREAHKTEQPREPAPHDFFKLEESEFPVVKKPTAIPAHVGQRHEN